MRFLALGIGFIWLKLFLLIKKRSIKNAVFSKCDIIKRVSNF